MHFLKPYEANYYKRTGKTFTRYSFYNEHEWRFSPTQYRMHIMDENQFHSNTHTIQELNNRLLSEIKKFNMSDIDYVFVNNKRELTYIVNYFEEKVKHKELEQLKLRLTTITKLIEN